MTVSHDHERMLQGVEDNWYDALGCRSCQRQTSDPLSGHDGFCPIPVMFTLKDEVARLRAARETEEEERNKLRADLESETRCRWTYDEHHDKWDTGCNNAFTLLNDGPQENGLIYCPYCGAHIYS